MVMKEERGRNPPSRHLWVGNLPQGIAERDLADRFIRFGELESLAFQPGRSYAFLNFKHDEDAFEAIESLQGFSLSGNPLRIEFAKAVSLLSSSHLLLPFSICILVFVYRICDYMISFRFIWLLDCSECLVQVHMIRRVLRAYLYLWNEPKC